MIPNPYIRIGAGEAATHEARRRGATVAIIDRDLFGGSCPFWADRATRTLVGALIADRPPLRRSTSPSSRLKTRTPLALLADTITAFPTVARVMGGLFVEAARELGAV